ncbi:MAG: SRPBCC family protein [Byssovorax sp.]
MWFDLEATDLDFIESSPYVLENEGVIDASPARVFEIFAYGEAQIQWFKDFVECRWTTEAPYGVGSTREIELKMLTVKERFLVWDPGERLTFTIYATTMPLMTAMMEDIRFDEMDGGRQTRFRWRVHYRPSLVMKLVHPLGRKIFGGMFTTTMNNLAKYAASHPGLR